MTTLFVYMTVTIQKVTKLTHHTTLNSETQRAKLLGASTGKLASTAVWA